MPIVRNGLAGEAMEGLGIACLREELQGTSKPDPFES